jgi:hypothetical protein
LLVFQCHRFSFSAGMSRFFLREGSVLVVGFGFPATEVHWPLPASFLPGHLVLVRACLAPDPFTVSGPVSRESLIFCFRSNQGSRQVDSSSLCAFSIFVLLIGFCRFCPRSREVLGSPAGACIVPLEAFSSASGERLLSLPHTA